MSDFENPNSQQSSEFNPYAAPTVDAQAESVLSSTDSEQIRKHYLAHEASLKSVSLLYLIGGVVLLVLGVGLLTGRVGDILDDNAILGSGFVLLAALPLVAAVGLRKLMPWVKIPAAIVAAAGLLRFNFGMIISLYILYLIFSEKGKMVLSPEYQKIMAETPHIKYKTSKIIWVLLAIVGILLLAGLIGFLVAA